MYPYRPNSYAQMYPYQSTFYPYYPSYGQPEDYGSEPMDQPEDRSMQTMYDSQNGAMRTMYGSQNNMMRTMYGPQNDAAPDGAMYPSSQGQRVGLPQPSGPLKLPPPAPPSCRCASPPVSHTSSSTASRLIPTGRRAIS